MSPTHLNGTPPGWELGWALDSMKYSEPAERAYHLRLGVIDDSHIKPSAIRSSTQSLISRCCFTCSDRRSGANEPDLSETWSTKAESEMDELFAIAFSKVGGVKAQSAYDTFKTNVRDSKHSDARARSEAALEHLCHSLIALALDLERPERPFDKDNHLLTVIFPEAIEKFVKPPEWIDMGEYCGRTQKDTLGWLRDKFSTKMSAVEAASCEWSLRSNTKTSSDIFPPQKQSSGECFSRASSMSTPGAVGVGLAVSLALASGAYYVYTICSTRSGENST